MGFSDIEYELLDKEHTKLTVSDLRYMTEAYNILSDFSDMVGDSAKLLLFWLDQKGIEYEIKSEFDFDAEKSKLLIVRM